MALRAERSGTTRHKRRLGETRTPRHPLRRPRLPRSEPLVVDPITRVRHGARRRRQRACCSSPLARPSAQTADEALSVGVLHRLPGLDEEQAYTASVRPGIQDRAAELGAVVEHDAAWQAAGRGKPPQHVDHARSGQGGVHLDGWTLPGQLDPFTFGKSEGQGQAELAQVFIDAVHWYLDPAFLGGRLLYTRLFPRQEFNEASRIVKPTPVEPYMPAPMEEELVLDPTDTQINSRIPWWLWLLKFVDEPGYDPPEGTPPPLCRTTPASVSRRIQLRMRTDG